MRSGKERDIDERKRHCAMDVIAKIAVLALGEHPHAGARAAVGRRRLHAHRQRFDESVEAAGVLEIPAYPTVVPRLGAEIIAALRRSEEGRVGKGGFST